MKYTCIYYTKMLSFSSGFSQNQALILSTALAAGSAIFAFYIYKFRICNKYWYQEWKHVGKVSNLYIYPLKSGRYVELKRAVCTSFGLKQLPEDERAFQLMDRFLIIYREADKSYCTSKTFPKMVLIEASVHDHEHFAFEAPEMRTLYVKIPSQKEQENKGNIFLWGNQKIMTIDCGDEAAMWVSRYILGADSGLRLGYHNASERRNLKEGLPEFLKVYPNLRNESTGLYADIANYLVVNEKSVKELNSCLKDVTISHKNFRPNIVINGGDSLSAYDEDNWEYLKIGRIVFKFVKYCPRCFVVNVDVDKGTRIPGGEPVTTLKKDRKLKDLKNIKLEGESPLFGSYFDVVEGLDDVINVDDEVFVKRR